MPSRRSKPARNVSSRKSSRAGGRRRAKEAADAGLVDFADFVVEGRRKGPRQIEVRVASSPAGAMRRPMCVEFPDSEARRLRESFSSWSTADGEGRMLIDVKQATEIGKRLARVLLPPPVFNLLAASLAEQRRAGMRVRLSLDASLIDLPWDYIYRPDRLDADGVSGFLLYDPTISLVRLAANPRIEVKPIRGAAPLRFVGALWNGGVDGWEVRTEFARLCQALRPVSEFVLPSFETATELELADGVPRETAIFHYGGHCAIDENGRGFLVREAPSSGEVSQARKIYVDELADTLTKTRTRVVVLSACNSGFWPIAQPLINAGIPVVIGVNGSVASTSTIEFCARFYESLALGLSLDEAVDRARLAVIAWNVDQDLFD